MKRLIVSVLLIISAAGIAGVSALDIDENKTLDLEGIEQIVFELKSPNCILCINTGNQYYSFTGTEGSELALSVEGTLKTNNRKAVPSLITSKTGRTLTVRLFEDQNLFFGLVQNGSFTFYAELPNDYRGSVSVSLSSGDSLFRDIRTGSMEIKTSSGDIELTDINAENLKIDASSGRITAGTLSAADSLSVKASSGDIAVSEAAGGNITVDASSGRISLDRMNAAGKLSIDARSGRITAGSLSGSDVVINSSSGKIIIESIEADQLRMDASSGSISLDSLECGKADIESSSGGLTLASASGSITYKGSSGSLEIGISELTGSLDLVNKSGSVYLTLPSSASFNADLEASSGKITSDFPILGDLSSKERGRIEGSVNGGGHSLRVKASSGNITIKSSQD